MGGEIEQVSGSLSQPYWVLQPGAVKRKGTKGTKGSALASCPRQSPSKSSTLCPRQQCSERRVGVTRNDGLSPQRQLTTRTIGLVALGGITELRGEVTTGASLTPGGQVEAADSPHIWCWSQARMGSCWEPGSPTSLPTLKFRVD